MTPRALPSVINGAQSSARVRFPVEESTPGIEARVAAGIVDAFGLPILQNCAGNATVGRETRAEQPSGNGVVDFSDEGEIELILRAVVAHQHRSALGIQDLATLRDGKRDQGFERALFGEDLAQLVGQAPWVLGAIRRSHSRHRLDERANVQPVLGIEFDVMPSVGHSRTTSRIPFNPRET
jgi:hypothetical protein